MYRVGLIGTGYIARGLAYAVAQAKDLRLARVLTRRALQTCGDFSYTHTLTHSVDQLIESADVIVECSGSIRHATEVVDRVLVAGVPVVTLNAELQVTTGSYLAGRGVFTEAEGDQPGTLAWLGKEAEGMGFRVLVYGNIKGFLNQNPTPEEMDGWAKKQGLSLEMVVSSTDGTKLQIEQALVANGMGVTLARRGLTGGHFEDYRDGIDALTRAAVETGAPISDYFVSPRAPKGVFVVCEHEAVQQPYLQYLKMGNGPHYTLLRNYYLLHLEMLRTIRAVCDRQTVLLNNGMYPRATALAVAKRVLKAGTRLRRGIGSFEVRGEAALIAEYPDAAPIGLLEEAVVRQKIEPGQHLTFHDVDLPDSLALRAWQTVMERTKEPTR